MSKFSITDAKAANSITDIFERGVFYANKRNLIAAARCFVSAHQDGHPYAARYLKAIRPYLDDLQIGLVGIDIVARC